MSRNLNPDFIAISLRLWLGRWFDGKFFALNIFRLFRMNCFARYMCCAGGQTKCSNDFVYAYKRFQMFYFHFRLSTAELCHLPLHSNTQQSWIRDNSLRTIWIRFVRRIWQMVFHHTQVVSGCEQGNEVQIYCLQCIRSSEMQIFR